MKQDDPQFKLRIPADLKSKLEEDAERNTRTLGAEIVARLQETFTPGKSSSAEVERLRGELKRQEYLATRFEMVAETTDKVLAIAGRLLHETIEQFPAADKSHLVDETMAKIIGTWVVPDAQGAVRDLLILLDGSEEVKASLKEFLRRLEERDGADAEPHKPKNTKLIKSVLRASQPENVHATVRGKDVDTGVPSPAVLQAQRQNKKEPSNRSAPVNKVILVGNLGRDPDINYLPARTGAENATEKIPPNRGPIRRTRNKPPK
ncbi:Arc family DNA-binding protein [Rhodoferax ferrireducens]|uniref:Arc family DNA-binding protein n=1 Tax=Rhodoferax ferrireducens TaxID=192843 RepID=UPI000E0D9792|nr:Arc family DNA-binding protein [Rhodoferax ferrireducens]